MVIKNSSFCVNEHQNCKSGIKYFNQRSVVKHFVCCIQHFLCTGTVYSFSFSILHILEPDKFGGVGGSLIPALWKAIGLFLLPSSGLKAKGTKRKEKVKDKNVKNMN